jgi:rare lipoprotein A
MSLPRIRHHGLFAGVLALLLLGGCTTAELAVDLLKKSHRQTDNVVTVDPYSDQEVVTSTTVPATVTANPVYKVGDPYQIAGIWYYPERNLGYDETGIGSWYGDEFAGRLTANGEIFDPDKVTAAHKTLPMPSVVRVTNLDNGKSLVVRVNDRGPFVAGRIIDLSREAARLIGYQKAGIARVRVQVLAEQSLRLEKMAKQGDFASLDTAVDTEMPEVAKVNQPEVSMTAKSSSGLVKNSTGQDNGVSAVELLARSRVGEVISVGPIETEIWVQIGAFYAEANATNVLAKVASVGEGMVSPVEISGQTLHRVRIGPLKSVEDADKALDGVIDLGFSGARIIVD